MLIFFAVMEVLLSVAIILFIAFQTTKSEGLSGIIGGASSSSFGKSGSDRMLEKFTKYVAVGWFICTAVTTWLYYRT